MGPQTDKPHSARRSRGQMVNRQAYDKIAPTWDRARSTFYGRERDYLDALLHALPVPSAILDLGCGTGRPMAEHVLSRGHRLTGVDQAAGMLELARKRFPTGMWVESTLEDFETPARFAGILCWDTLFHIERSRHRGLLARMAGMLVAGGRLMITVGGSDHPPFMDAMFGETFFYDSYPPNEVLSLLRQLGFETVIAEFMNVPTGGRDKGRYAIVAQLQEKHS